jgi:hypothetical protein
MMFASTSDALDRLAPAHDFVSDWNDVVARAGVPVGPRRPWLRRLVVVAVVLAAVGVPLTAVAASQDWWFFAAGHAPVPVTPVGVVKTGEWDGKRWVLAAYRSGTDGVCYSMSPASSANSTGQGGAMGCDQIEGVPRTEQSKRYTPHAITYLSGSASPDLPAYIVGPVIDRAVTVEVFFAEGRTLRTETFEAARDLGSIRFYAAELPEGVQLGPGPGFLEKLVGLDGDGQIVACMTFPMPEEGVPLSACR